jgi:hypothetical protein
MLNITPCLNERLHIDDTSHKIKECLCLKERPFPTTHLTPPCPLSPFHVRKTCVFAHSPLNHIKMIFVQQCNCRNIHHTQSRHCSGCGMGCVTVGRFDDSGYVMCSLQQCMAECTHCTQSLIS